jgi:hypothetical protein
MQPLLSRFTKVAVFAIAMGCLEAIVVVYLRELFYPQGFDFPLHDMPPHLILIELSREVATLVMLLMVGHLAGNTALQRFAFFAIGFAVWDIFYYVFLFIFFAMAFRFSYLGHSILNSTSLGWSGVGPFIACCYHDCRVLPLFVGNRARDRLPYLQATLVFIVVGFIAVHSGLCVGLPSGLPSSKRKHPSAA